MDLQKPQQNTKNSALLVMDMQAGILAMASDVGALTNNVAKAIASARNRYIPVIYVVLGFRTGTPEISINNQSFFYF